MRADDLVRPVALDALGAGVPGRDPAVGIEQKNRIVDHALDQDPKQLVTAGHQGQARSVFFDAQEWDCSGRSPAIPSEAPTKSAGASFQQMNRNFRLRCNPPAEHRFVTIAARPTRATRPGRPASPIPLLAKQGTTDPKRRAALARHRPSGIVRRDATRSPDHTGSRARRRRPCACACAEALWHAARARRPRDADHARSRNAVFGHAAGLCRRTVRFRRMPYRSGAAGAVCRGAADP